MYECSEDEIGKWTILSVQIAQAYKF